MARFSAFLLLFVLTGNHVAAQVKAPVNPVKAPVKAPTTPVKAPTAPIKATPASPDIEPVAPVKSPPTVVKAPVVPVVVPIAPVKATTPIVNKAPTTPAAVKAPVAPVKAPSTPVTAPVTPVKAPVAPVKAPVTTPVKSPVSTPKVAPVASPVAAPTKPTPVKAPVSAPVAPVKAVPIKAVPVKAPVSAPATSVKAPVSEPVKVPVKAPVAAPVVAPVSVIISVPVAPPVSAPIAPPVSTPVAPNVTRINAGGEAHVDSLGNEWMADAYFNEGNEFGSCPKAVNGTAEDDLYCTFRWFHAPIAYNVPVPAPAKYLIRLHFAEIYYEEVGKRAFNIFVENAKVMEQLDVVKVAGASTAFIVEVQTAVTDGFATVHLIGMVENPMISAIEVIRMKGPLPPVAPPTRAPTTAPATPDVTVARINVGGAAFVDSDGDTWEADTNTNGSGFGSCPKEVAGTVNDDLYCTYRWFGPWHPSPHRYEIPVPTKSKYLVRLHFAEIYFDTTNQRVFDVLVENVVAFNDLDVIKAVGPSKAHIVNITTVVVDGFVTIDLVGVIENPFLSAIEVVLIPGPLSPMTPPTRAPVAAPMAFADLLINSGGDSYVENAGLKRTWLSDRFYQMGATYSDTSKVINGTNEDGLYQSERWGEFTYDIPVPSGSYEITVHMAEIYHQAIGERKFTMAVEGTIVNNIDILAEVGYQTAYKLSFVRMISDGAITIALSNSIPQVGSPTISGIEIKAK